MYTDIIQQYINNIVYNVNEPQYSTVYDKRYLNIDDKYFEISIDINNPLRLEDIINKYKNNNLDNVDENIFIYKK